MVWEVGVVGRSPFAARIGIGGLVDTFRFVNQFTTGHGNYTNERDALFGHLTLDDQLAATR